LPCGAAQFPVKLRPAHTYVFGQLFNAELIVGQVLINFPFKFFDEHITCTI
jgi:hypothetical protein